jgi:aspartyl-tRNA(Asn)/glutamyl-tRNA(Gln) amidotransferase subunit C
MSLDNATVAKIARLARLKMEEAELAPMAGQLNAILDFVAKLDAVNVDGVPPMTSVVGMQLRRREDAVTDGGDPAKVLRNAPQAQSGYFTVPKVIE